MKNINKKKISRQLFKATLGLLFGYFGFLAIVNPALEAAKWISPNISNWIELIIPLNIFMLILGAVQLILAVLLIADKFSQIVLLIAMLLLLGIIINLGYNEIALRDLTILAGIIYLYFSDNHQREGKAVV